MKISDVLSVSISIVALVFSMMNLAFMVKLLERIEIIEVIMGTILGG